MPQGVLAYFGWLSLVALFLLACWLAIVAIQRWKRGGRVQCPVCAEWIQAGAVKCRFCGTELRGPAKQAAGFPAQAAIPVAPAQPAPPAPSAPPPSAVESAPVSPAPAGQPPAEPAIAPTPAAGPAIATAPAQPSQATEVAAERSKVAAGIERMRHTPADQQPPGFYGQVLDWLHDADPQVRKEAVRYLAKHCANHDDAAHLLEMVARDSDPEVRRAAAECLGGIFRAMRNREAAEVLAEVARNSEEEGAVRAAAYAAIRRINGY